MKRIVFITGATSGFGEAIARRFAQDGDQLILTGRRKDRLDKLSRELQDLYEVPSLALSFDIRSRKAAEEAVNSLPEEWKQIDILVNNAGLAAGLDPIDQADPDDWDRMIDTNVKGLLYISRAIIPLMTARGHGHIFNIGSIAGKEVYPKGNVYCATKHAVDALTKGMRMDLLAYGIRITQIAPGAAETEFSFVRFKGDAEKARQVYQGFEPLKAEDIAGIVFYVASLPERISISDMLVTPAAQASMMLINRKT
jgi:hypothetical protein